MIYMLLAAFLAALVIAWISIPVVIKVAEQKHLYDEPDEQRKSHQRKIPTLGGIAIFAGIVISATFFAHQSESLDLGAFLSAMTILFFTGIKDDIIPLPPYKKFIAQLLAASIIVLWGKVRLSSFYGFFFLHDVPVIWLSFASIFTIIVIINAFNLIDGINGLAGGVGCIVLAVFGAWFYLHKEEALAIWAFASCGAIVGFLWYNLRTHAKIFMGDTGSLILGFISAVFAIQFIEMNKIETSFEGGKAPIFAVAVLIIPLFDTIRVFTIRIANKRSPFSGDRNHLHHLLLDIGFNHVQSSLILFGITFFYVGLGHQFRELSSYWYLAILAIPILCITQMLVWVKRRKKKLLAKEQNSNTLQYELSSETP